MSVLEEWENKIICGRNPEALKPIPDESMDELATDPPYGYSFMGRDWDKAVPNVEVWRECLRVMKPGAFGFILCAPRQDCLSRMIVNLEDAGFWVNFSSIYWTYASGFPKAQNISKAIDKKECKKQLEEKLGRKPTRKEFEEEWKKFRKVIGTKTHYYPDSNCWGVPRNISSDGFFQSENKNTDLSNISITIPTTPQAKALDGSYGGFQPKPAVEVVIVVMKPLSEKTFVDQALKNGKGVTWLDEGRIPYENKSDKDSMFRPITNGSPLPPKKGWNQNSMKQTIQYDYSHGRFSANLLVQDDVLNDGRNRHPAGNKKPNTIKGSEFWKNKKNMYSNKYAGDFGSFSRYFDLDRWFAEKIKRLPKSVQKTFPFLIVPKASKVEKNRGCENLTLKRNQITGDWKYSTKGKSIQHNYHPTVKPLKLMCYLVMLGSREGDVVLDPYVGSGTTALACQILNRRYIGFDDDSDYVKIANERLRQEILSL